MHIFKKLWPLLPKLHMPAFDSFIRIVTSLKVKKLQISKAGQTQTIEKIYLQ